MTEQDTLQYDPPTPAIMQVEITNRNEFPISDFFDGIPYIFASDEKVTVSLEVAQHCFGYPGEPGDMAVYMARRYGWASKEMLDLKPGPNKASPLYETLAANVEIVPVYYELRRVDRNAPILADTEAAGEDEPVPIGSTEDGATKVGRRKRTPARLGGKTEQRAAKKAGKASRR